MPAFARMARSGRRGGGGSGGPLPGWWRWAALAVAVLGLAWLALSWGKLRAEARLGAAVGAHVACSCHYIEGRPLADCRKDFEPGMGLVMLSADEDAKSVTARMLPLASQTARYKVGPGCVMDGWK